MSELRDRLERLAARGTRRGADDVLHDAIGSAPDAATEVDAEDFDLEILDGDAPFVDADPERHRRSRYGTLVATLGAAALLGVGVLAVTAMFGSGGASSPEGAVRQLADAVSHKDPLAAVDVLVPSEVRSMRETIKHVTKRAADLKIVDDASAPLAGVDLSVDNLQLSTENLADGYAKVTIVAGKLSTTTQRSAMSKLLQDAINNSNAGDFKGNVDLARLAANADLPTFVVVVRQGGGWYVSPAYTALEYGREAAGGPAASFGSADAAQLGADSPEAAVSDALHAWQAGDWNRLMALAPPDELPVYDYRAWINQEAAGDRPDFTIDKLTTTATVNGDTAVVKLDASGTTGSGNDRGTWQVGGTCPTFDAFSQSSSSVASGDSTGTVTYPSSDSSTSRLCLAGDLGNAVPFGLFVGFDETTPPPSGSVSVEAVKEGGKWFVSPVSTALDVVNSAIDHIDQQTLYPLIGLGYLLPPEATITLNQPFSVTGSNFAHVYAFDGTKGERVIGETDGANFSVASGELYTADGHEVDTVEFAPKSEGFGASLLTLPDTGSYRVVVTGGVAKNTTLTLFDEAHAPKSLLHPDFGSGSSSESFSNSAGTELCGPAPGGGTKCSTSTTVVPRIMPGVPSSSVSVNSGPASTVPSSCTGTASNVACSGSARNKAA